MRKYAESQFKMPLKMKEVTVNSNNVTIQFSANMSGALELMRMLSYIANIGNEGHSFSIVVDPHCSDTAKTFNWDGDGADRLRDITILDKDSKPVKLDGISHTGVWK